MFNTQQSFTPVAASFIFQLKCESIHLREQMRITISESFSRIRRTDELLNSPGSSYSKIKMVKISREVKNIPVRKKKTVAATSSGRKKIKPKRIATETVNGNGQELTGVAKGRKFEIDVNDKYEMGFWCKSLNVSRPEILRAIEETRSKYWKAIHDYFIS